MVLLLSEADVVQALSMADAIELIEQALHEHASGSTVLMPRMSADVGGTGGAFRVMPAILPASGFFGLKTLTGYPGRRLAGETYFALLLFSTESGALRAVIAGNELTGIRTGAATGVAAKHLARADSRVVGLFGGGVQGRQQVRALAEVCAIDEVRVFDVDRHKAEAMARRIERELELQATAVAAASSAVIGCDLVVTATTSKTPVFDGEWLTAGTHVSGVGANSPVKHELDFATLKRSRIVVDFREQVLEEAGDLRAALAAGAIGRQALDAELADIVAGHADGRRDDQEITLFKSVGVAIQDIAVASFVYKRALATGLGLQLDLQGSISSAGTIGVRG